MTRFTSKRMRTGFAALLAGTLPSTAFGHLVNTGMGPVYDGIGHLVMTPEDLVPALGIALYCGLRGRRAGRQAMFVLPVLWLLGGWYGLTLDTLPAFPVTALSFLLLGLLIATDARLPAHIVTPLVGVVGMIHGILNGIALQSGPGGLALLGISGAVFAIVALLAAFVVSLKRPWLRIVVRVMGSWMAASGVLMVGWFFRGQLY